MINLNYVEIYPRENAYSVFRKTYYIGEIMWHSSQSWSVSIKFCDCKYSETGIPTLEEAKANVERKVLSTLQRLELTPWENIK